MASVRVAVRSWPMREAARMSWPVTSPTISARRTGPRGMTSNQSPPTSAAVSAGDVPVGELKAGNVGDPAG